MAEPSGFHGSRIWRGASARPAAKQKPSSGKRTQIIALSAAILLLVGAIAAWVFYPSPVRSPYFLAIFLSEYTDARIPVSPWSNQDRQALLALPWRDNNAFTSQQRNLLLQELRNLEKDRKADEPVVVYLSAYALTGPDGKVGLLPGDARIDDPAGWLPMDEVLKYVRLCPAKHKLLILDVAQPFTDPAAGVLINDVADRLQPALQAAVAEDSNLQILCACSPGQVSVSSEELGHTVFGHYLIQGLYGRADGCNPQRKRDDRVSVRELAEYVTSHVDRWAWMNRRARQTPVLLGSGGDFHVLAVEPGQVPPEAAGLDAAYPDWLRSRWVLRDRWWNDRSFRAAGRAYQELETALLRAEQQYRAGVDPTRIQNDLAARIRRLQQQRDERVQALDRPEANSLALVVAQGRKPPDLAGGDVLQQLKDLTALNGRVQVPKPDEKEKTQLAVDRDKFLKPFKDEPFELAWTVFELALAESNPRPEQIRFWNDLLRRNPRQPSYVETRFLQRLADLKIDNPKDWPAETVHTTLHVVAEAEKARAGDPLAMPWVKAVRDAAARKRRDGEAVLFAAEPASRAKAKQLLTEALRDYQLVNQHLLVIQEAQRKRDEALVLLPSYPPYLQFDPASEKAWLDAVQTARSLQEVLADPADPNPLPDRISKMGELTDTLRNNLKTLQQPVEPIKLKRLINQSGRANLTDWLEMDALFTFPWTSARDRAALWTAWRALARRLQNETQEMESGADHQQLSRNAPPTFDADKARRQELDRALSRARCSIALLSLAPGTEVKKLEAALSQVSRQPTPAAWDALSRALRQAWVKRLTD